MNQFKLSIYELGVYVALCSHRNDTTNSTFVGYRRIAKNLGISKTTVAKCIKKLEACHLVVRQKASSGRPSQLEIYAVPAEGALPYRVVVPKDMSNENFKEKKSPREITMQALREKYPKGYQSMYGDTPPKQSL